MLKINTNKTIHKSYVKLKWRTYNNKYGYRINMHGYDIQL